MLSHVAQGNLAPDSVRKRSKAPLGKRASCKVWTDGTDTILTFLQGLGHWADPLEGRFRSEFQVRRQEFTEKHIRPFRVAPVWKCPFNVAKHVLPQRKKQNHIFSLFVD